MLSQSKPTFFSNRQRGRTKNRDDTILIAARESDDSVESAVAQRPYRDRSAVGFRYRAHNRQAETDSSTISVCVAVPALERLEEMRQILTLQIWSRVGDGKDSLRIPRANRHAHPAASAIYVFAVDDRICYEV